jgi:hypothetical protein
MSKPAQPDNILLAGLSSVGFLLVQSGEHA